MEDLLKILIKKLKKRVFIALFCIVSTVLLTSFGNDDPKGIKVIVIDAGHGGQDPGCNGVSHLEKDISLSVALKFGQLIEENCKDVKVIYTRKTDVFVSLDERAAIANRNKANLFISIHCNAAGKPVMIRDKKTKKMRAKTFVNKRGKRVPVETINPIPFGTETYVMGVKNEEGKMRVASRENSVIFLEEDYKKNYEGFDPESEESYIIMSNYTSAYVIQSASLALKIQNEYIKKAGRVDKGVHRQSLLVLWKTAMPSILTEIGFLTNPLEEEFLASEKGQKYLAASIFKGFRKFKDEVEGKKKEYDDEFEKMEPLENENLKAGNTGKVEEQKDFVEEDASTGSASDSVKTKEVVLPKKEEEKVTSTGSATAISTGSATVTPKNETNEEKPDSIPKIIVVKEEIKGNKGKEETKEKEGTEGAKGTEEKKKTEENINITNENKKIIEYKVQFAGSEKELDLKEKKYSIIENGWFYKTGSTFRYTSGNFKTSREAFAHQKKLNENGFKDAFVVAFKNREKISLPDAKKFLEQK